ncbi:MAG: hypothetical protein ACJAV5_001796 [Vicingaceae bacterium]|jgi:hypothetical protein
MNHPKLTDYTLVEQLDYIDFYSNPSSDTLIVRFKESTVVSADMAKESLDLILNYKKDHTTYGITDLSAKFLDFTTEAKNYYRKHMDKDGVALNAVVVKDIALKIIANTYARFDRPQIPTRVFTSLAEAAQWIEDAKP